MFQVSKHRKKLFVLRLLRKFNFLFFFSCYIFIILCKFSAATHVIKEEKKRILKASLSVFSSLSLKPSVLYFFYRFWSFQVFAYWCIEKRLQTGFMSGLEKISSEKMAVVKNEFYSRTHRIGREVLPKGFHLNFHEFFNNIKVVFGIRSKFMTCEEASIASMKATTASAWENLRKLFTNHLQSLWWPF